MDYGKIISRGWEIGWQNKYLWALGLLAAFGLGSGNSGGTFDFDTSTGELPPGLRDGPLGDLSRVIESGDMNGSIEFFSKAFAVFGVIIAITCVLSIIFWVVGSAARIGLVSAVNKIETGEKTTFGASLSAGFSRILPIFFMKLLLFSGLIIFILLAYALLVGMIIALGDSGGGVIFIICGSCGAVLFILALSFLFMFTDAYAYRGIVIRGLGVIEGLKHGWQVTRENWQQNFVLALIWALINLLIGIVILMVTAPIALLFANPMFDYLTTGDLGSGTLVSFILGAIILGAITAVLYCIFVVWQSATFTLAYRELTGLSAESFTTEKSPEDLLI